MADEQAAPDPEQQRRLGQMSFMDHLGELRTRIMWSLVAAGTVRGEFTLVIPYTKGPCPSPKP